MTLLNLFTGYSQIAPLHLSLSSRPRSPLLCLASSSSSSSSSSLLSNKPKPSFFSATSSPQLSLCNRHFLNPNTRARVESGEFEVRNTALSTGFDDLDTDGVVYRNTLRLVECSMFAAVAGLLYFLSNSLAIENYFSCFFALPIVISSMRWGLSAGRKTMVATTLLLLTLSGPVKASTYLLMHGLVGLCMGTMWRMGADWGHSIALCTLVRAMGAVGYVLLSSFLIRENILALITINIHASLSYLLTAIGVNTIPSMNSIYAIFGTLVLLNCGFFIFLLHIIYAIFFVRLGMKKSLTLPRWLEKAL